MCPRARDQIVIVSIYPYETGWRGRFLLPYCLWHFLRPGCWRQKSMCCQRILDSPQTSHSHPDRLHVRFRFFRKNFCLPMKNFLTKINRSNFLRHLYSPWKSQNGCHGEPLKAPPALPGRFSDPPASSMRKDPHLQFHSHIRFFGYNPEWQPRRSAGLFPRNTS